MWKHHSTQSCLLAQFRDRDQRGFLRKSPFGKSITRIDAPTKNCQTRCCERRTSRVRERIAKSLSNVIVKNHSSGNTGFSIQKVFKEQGGPRYIMEQGRAQAQVILKTPASNEFVREAGLSKRVELLETAVYSHGIHGMAREKLKFSKK